MKNFITPTLINNYVLETEPEFCKSTHRLAGMQVKEYGQGYMLYLYAENCTNSIFYFTDDEIEHIAGNYPLIISKTDYQKFMIDNCGEDYINELIEIENVRHNTEMKRLANLSYSQTFNND